MGAQRGTFGGRQEVLREASSATVPKAKLSERLELKTGWNGWQQLQRGLQGRHEVRRTEPGLVQTRHGLTNAHTLATRVCIPRQAEQITNLGPISTRGARTMARTRLSRTCAALDGGTVQGRAKIYAWLLSIMTFVAGQLCGLRKATLKLCEMPASRSHHVCPGSRLACRQV